MELHKYKIAAFTSCIRNISFFKTIYEDIKIKDKSNKAQSGDLVLLRITDCNSGYGIVEDYSAENVKLNKGDYIVTTLGNRFSGTNVYGELLKSKISKGDLLFQLSISGIYGNYAFVENFHNNGKATEAELIGFLEYNQKVLNIKDINNVFNNIPKQNNKSKNIFVFGTSAEVGKTTFVCNLAKTKPNNSKISCAKVCGTGRLKDKNNYLKSNCNFAIDYVDLGYPTTYKQSVETIKNIIKNIEIISSNNADYCIYEVGGDMLEGGADTILEFAKSINAYIFIVVNDAMGALYARQLLDNYKYYVFVAWKPNIKALSERLNEKVYNIYSTKDVKKLWELINE